MAPGKPGGGRPHEPDCPSDPGGYGLLSRLRRSMDRHRPPGVPLRRRWRSPLRGPWLTSVFGTVLLIGLPIMIITGLLSYMAYAPRFGQALPAHVGWLKLPTFDWPSRPAWLYRLTQGVHVGLGLVLVPVVIAKLWSVIPRLFIWPPARSIAQVLERISLVMLVGGILFEIATGLLFIQYDMIFRFPWHTAHYFGAWVFIAGRLSDQQDRRGRRDRPGRDRRRVAADPDRRVGTGVARPCCTGRDATAHRTTADRLRPRLVHDPNLERRATGRPGRGGRCASAAFGASAIAAENRGQQDRRLQPRRVAGESGT